MHRVFRGDSWLRGVRLAASTVFIVGVAFVVSPCAYARVNLNSGSRHNFVQYGFTGGGVCDECHAAGGGGQNSLRLYRWGTAATDMAMCTQTCHNPTTPAWPTGPEWGSVSANYNTYRLPTTRGPNPPRLPHTFGVPPARCDSFCHWPSGAAADYRDCLRCHTNGQLDARFGRTPTNSDIATELEIDKFMNGIGTVTDPLILSQHNIVYNTAADLSLPANNECLKCHGTSAVVSHPGGADGTAFLVYPDDPDGPAGPRTTGQAIAKAPANNYALYQDFCLSCHDGQAVNRQPATANMKFGSPAVNVPRLPRFDESYAALAYITGTPYLTPRATTPTEENYPVQNYFEMNGHGRATSIEGLAMNLTCMAQNPDAPGPTPGCHSAHGSQNRYLIEDSGNIGTAVDTPEELGSLVCMGCHDRATLSNNKFHGWLGGSTVLHAGAAVSYTYWANIRPSWLPPGNNMNVGNPNWPDAQEILPFFSGPNADLETGRQYGTRQFGNRDWGTQASPKDPPTETLRSILTCITCHEPHGSSDTYLSYDVGGIHTMGMPRFFASDFSYTDDLCSACHVAP